MKQGSYILLALMLLLVVACTGSQRPTPTPFAKDTTPEQGLNSAGPLAISITDLAADPEAYANSFIEITGRFRRLPLLVCRTDAYPPPATWQLAAEDGSLVAVGGFDNQVRSLLPPDLTMTVAGAWRLFEGPVGCGKSATRHQIWYLKASDILAPSPIARVTLTPTGSAGQITQADGETAVPVSGTGSPPSPTPSQTPAGLGGAPTAISTAGPATPTTSTATRTAATPTGTANGSSTATPTATSSNEPTTPTGTAIGVTATAIGGTLTPTATGGSGGTSTPTPRPLTTATRNPADFAAVEFDQLSPEETIIGRLDAEEAHLYPIAFDYNGAITITAVAEPSINLVIEIVDQADDVVQQANDGGNGALEAIVNAQLNVAQDYKIRLYDLNGSEGDYCLIFSEGGGFPDSIKGRIEYGQTVTNQVDILGIDYWCFLGQNGDNISLTITATGSTGDFVLGLYAPPDLETIGPAFTDAEIMNVALNEDGMYMIGVVDFDAEASDYSLTLTKN